MSFEKGECDAGDPDQRNRLSNERRYRPGLPEIPRRMRRLPVERGYPVPWFVARVGDGYDFRVADGKKPAQAILEKLCWLCGQPLGQFKAFVLGPMCTVTRTTSEPPSHTDCAKFALVACPFLIQQETGYREAGLPDGVTAPAGHAIKRQPGCAVLWLAKDFSLFEDGKGGTLIRVGDPVIVEWWSHGRRAYKSEIEESIASGFPILFEMAKAEGLGAILELNRQLEAAMVYVRR